MDTPVAIEKEKTMKNEPMFSCQNQGCAEEVSYHADMLAMWNGEPICDGCYSNEQRPEDAPDWYELPPFIPDYVKEAAALKNRVAELEDALKPFAEASQHLEINEKTKNRSIWAQMHQKPGCSQEYQEITYSHIGNAAATLNKERN